MDKNGWVASSQRLYRWLLHLYPQAYRNAYESEMFHLFTDQCREVYKRRGKLGILSLWFRTLVDVAITVVREHLGDPHAKVGLLEAVPNAPLPWMGVLLVLIPGLIFFISQIEQLTSDNDWFFLAFHRAGYVLILPVLLVWLLTRRFPVWGLIPLGLLYATVWNYGQRFQPSRLPFIGHLFARETVGLFGMNVSPYDVKDLLVMSLCMIALCALIWHGARQEQIPRSVWKWLGLYGLMIVVRIGIQAYHFLAWWPPEELKLYLLQESLWNSREWLPFLLLIFIGMLFARKYQGFSFLLLLGYLLPTVVFGRYDDSTSYVPFYVVSVVVLVYRFVIALIAPVWLVRAASVPARQRAAAIPVAIAILSQIILNFIFVLIVTGLDPYYRLYLSDFAPVIWGHLITMAGLGMVVALYLPRKKDQAVLSPPALIATAE